MAAVTIYSDFGAQKIKSLTVPIVFPYICHEVMRPDVMILVFQMLSFKPTFSLSSFTFVKRVLSSSSLSVIRVVSSVYLRSLIFLPVTLIPACASSSLAFHMMYSADKLNKQGGNMQPWSTASLVWNSLLFHVQWHEFEEALGAGVGQGSLACCSPWDHKESDTTMGLNWTDHKI